MNESKGWQPYRKMESTALKNMGAEISNLKIFMKENENDFIGLREQVEHDMLAAYRVEKPLSYVIIRTTSPEQRDEIIEGLGEYFFVETKSREESVKDARTHEEEDVETEHGVWTDVYVSRFKHLPEVAKEYLSGNEYSDLGGVLFGYDLKNVAGYAEIHGNFE